MASPGELVHEMADVLGIPKATVTQYDRALAENALRSKSGRGTSAAKVTARDAANLLIALATSPSAKDAVRNCKAYASLRNDVFSGQSPDNFAMFGLPILTRLPENHSFRDALTGIIDAAGHDEAFTRPPLDTSFEVLFTIAPTIISGRIVEILVDGRKDFGLTASLIYSDPRPPKVPRWAKGGRTITYPDFRRISRVGFRTIQALGSLVSGETTGSH